MFRSRHPNSLQRVLLGARWFHFGGATVEGTSAFAASSAALGGASAVELPRAGWRVSPLVFGGSDFAALERDRMANMHKALTSKNCNMLLFDGDAILRSPPGQSVERAVLNRLLSSGRIPRANLVIGAQFQMPPPAAGSHLMPAPSAPGSVAPEKVLRKRVADSLIALGMSRFDVLMISLSPQATIDSIRQARPRGRYEKPAGSQSSSSSAAGASEAASASEAQSLTAPPSSAAAADSCSDIAASDFQEQQQQPVDPQSPPNFYRLISFLEQMVGTGLTQYYGFHLDLLSRGDEHAWKSFFDIQQFLGENAKLNHAVKARKRWYAMDEKRILGNNRDVDGVVPDPALAAAGDARLPQLLEDQHHCVMFTYNANLLKLGALVKPSSDDPAADGGAGAATTAAGSDAKNNSARSKNTNSSNANSNSSGSKTGRSAVTNVPHSNPKAYSQQEAQFTSLSSQMSLSQFIKQSGFVQFARAPLDCVHNAKPFRCVGTGIVAEFEHLQQGLAHPSQLAAQLGRSLNMACHLEAAWESEVMPAALKEEAEKAELERAELLAAGLDDAAINSSNNGAAQAGIPTLASLQSEQRHWEWARVLANNISTFDSQMAWQYLRNLRILPHLEKLMRAAGRLKASGPWAQKYQKELMETMVHIDTLMAQTQAARAIAVAQLLDQATGVAAGEAPATLPAKTLSILLNTGSGIDGVLTEVPDCLGIGPAAASAAAYSQVAKGPTPPGSGKGKIASSATVAAAPTFSIASIDRQAWDPERIEQNLVPLQPKLAEAMCGAVPDV